MIHHGQILCKTALNGTIAMHKTLKYRTVINAIIEFDLSLSTEDMSCLLGSIKWTYSTRTNSDTIRIRPRWYHGLWTLHAFSLLWHTSYCVQSFTNVRWMLICSCLAELVPWEVTQPTVGAEAALSIASIIAWYCEHLCVRLQTHERLWIVSTDRIQYCCYHLPLLNIQQHLMDPQSRNHFVNWST